MRKKPCKSYNMHQRTYTKSKLVVRKTCSIPIGLAAKLLSRWTMRRAGPNPWQWLFNLCFSFGCNPTNLKLDHYVSTIRKAAPFFFATVQLAKDLFGVPAAFFVTATQQIVSCPRWFWVLMMFQDGRLFKGQSSITSSTLCTYYCSQKVHLYWNFIGLAWARQKLLTMKLFQLPSTKIILN